MTKKKSLQLFEEKKVRTAWDDKEEKWYFSIVYVCGVLTEQPNNEQLFHIIQSIPSPKAEPFKVWMVQVASTRMEQMQELEKSIDQAFVDCKRLGIFRCLDKPAYQVHRNQERAKHIRQSDNVYVVFASFLMRNENLSNTGNNINKHLLFFRYLKINT